MTDKWAGLRERAARWTPDTDTTVSADDLAALLDERDALERERDEWAARWRDFFAALSDDEKTDEAIRDPVESERDQAFALLREIRTLLATATGHPVGTAWLAADQFLASLGETGT